MTLKKIIPAAIMAISATAVNAGGFDGPFVQLGIGGSATSQNTSGTAGAFDSDVNLDGKTSSGSVNGLVAAGYSQDMGAFAPALTGFNLAANIFYVIGNQNAGSKNSSISGTNMGDTESLSLNGTFKGKNTFGISVEPGWNFTDTTLGFVKLAWVNSQANGSYSWNYTCTNAGGDCGSTGGGQSASKNINGFGYGLGVKQLVTKNIFLGVDLMGVTYGSANMGDGIYTKPSQFMGFASIGYKF